MSKSNKARATQAQPQATQVQAQPPVVGGKRGVRVHAYPPATATVALAQDVASRGADQALRLAQVQAALANGPLTVQALVAACPGGRRTLRRAWRAGFLVLA